MLEEKKINPNEQSGPQEHARSSPRLNYDYANQGVGKSLQAEINKQPAEYHYGNHLSPVREGASARFLVTSGRENEIAQFQSNYERTGYSPLENSNVQFASARAGEYSSKNSPEIPSLNRDSSVTFDNKYITRRYERSMNSSTTAQLPPKQTMNSSQTKEKASYQRESPNPVDAEFGKQSNAFPQEKPYEKKGNVNKQPAAFVKMLKPFKERGSHRSVQKDVSKTGSLDKNSLEIQREESFEKIHKSHKRSTLSNTQNFTDRMQMDAQFRQIKEEA